MFGLFCVLAFPNSVSGNLFPGWGISVGDLSHDFVTLEWAEVAPGNRPDSYTLQYFFDGKWVTAGSAAPWRHRVDLTGLQPETTYSLRVLAHYGGSTVNSAGVQATTLRPFIGGIGLTVPDEEPDILRVQWLEQDDVTGYYIEWYRVVQAGAGSWFVGSQDLLNPAATTYRIPDLDPTLTYRVRVFAYLENTRTGWSPMEEETTGLGAPREVTVTGIGVPPSVHTTLSWRPVVVGGAARIKIERAPWAGAFVAVHEEVPNAGGWEDTSVFPGRFYTYRMLLDDGEGGQSGWAYGGAWTSRAAAPQDVTVDEAYGTQVHLSWEPVPGPVDYVIERYHDVGGSFDTWEEVGRTASTVFVDGHDENFPLLPGNDYLYRVRAYFRGEFLRDSDNSLYQYSEFSTNVTTTTTSAAPAKVTAAPGGNGSSITVEWSNVAGETGYEIERRTATLLGEFGPWMFLASRGADRLSLIDSDVSSGNRYRYRVRSGNDAGDSAWTESNIVSTSTGIPVNVRVEVLSDREVSVEWDPVTGANGYVVRRSNVDGTNPVDTVIGSGGTTQVVLDGLSGFSRYLIRVKSTQEGGPDSLFGQNVFTRTFAWLTANSSGLSVNLAWSDMTADPALNVSHYRVERRSPYGEWVEIAFFQATEGESYTDTEVGYDSTFEYRMRGWDPSDTFTPYSIIRDASIGPPPVTGFSLAGECYGEVQVVWDPANSAEEILLLLREPGEAGFSIFDTIPGYATTYVFSELDIGETYTFSAIAINSRGEGFSDQIDGTAADRLPAPPGLFGVSATGISSSAIRITWEEVDGNHGYRIVRRLSSVEPVPPYEHVADVPQGTTFYDDTGLPSGTSFHYRVSGLDACGNDGFFKGSGNATWTIIGEWRVSHWGNTSAVRNGMFRYADEADYDGDGWPNILEFWCDTDPGSAASKPEVGIAVTDTDVRFTWPTREDTDGFTPVFALSGNLDVFVPFSQVSGATVGTGPGFTTLVVPRAALIDGAPAGDRIFCRLEIDD